MQIYQKTYTIDEVSQMIEESKPTLRFWEQNFPTLRPSRDSKGIRKYSSKDVEELRKIKNLLKIEGFTLQGARKFLTVNKTLSINDIIKELKNLRDSIVKIKSC